jgi:hypothetical protein|tara:strand:- start:1059 stop:1406 length:348 start_codon:yes stop_codon:yes gene_type:complete
MTCGLHRTLDTAVTAVQVALTTAIESGVSDRDLDNLVCAYKGLKAVANANVTENVTTGISFVPDTTLGDTLTFNGEDIKIDTSEMANGTVSFNTDAIAGLGSDVITFGDDIDKDV